MTPPTITAPGAVAANTAPGTCAAAPALGSPVAADNLGAVAVTNNAPATFAKGTTVVTWTATDPAGHSASAAQSVVVNDTERPTVVAPANVTRTPASASGTVISTASLGTATSGDNCPGVSTPTPAGIPAGNLFPIGTTTIIWTATDASGNSSSALQTVTVAYGVCLLYDASRQVNSGAAIPIKLELCNAAGADLSSPALLPQAVSIGIDGSNATIAATDEGGANPSGVFRYDATLGTGGGYIFNLSTKGLASGAWHLTFTAGGQTYAVPFRIR